MLQKLDQISVPLTKHTEIFNGIQTSAERPTPIYWFSSEDIIAEYQDTIEIRRDGHNCTIEKLFCARILSLHARTNAD